MRRSDELAEAIPWTYCADTPATQHRRPNNSVVHPNPTCYKRLNYPPGGRDGQRPGVFERTSGDIGRAAPVELMGPLVRVHWHAIPNDNVVTSAPVDYRRHCESPGGGGGLRDLVLICVRRCSAVSNWQTPADGDNGGMRVHSHATPNRNRRRICPCLLYAT